MLLLSPGFSRTSRVSSIVFGQLLLLWADEKAKDVHFIIFTGALAHLITVGVISAQKKMLSVLTAWEENMPMMEKATENFLFRVSLRTGVGGRRGGEVVRLAGKPLENQTLCARGVPVSCRRLYFPMTGFHWKRRGED